MTDVGSVAARLRRRLAHPARARRLRHRRVLPVHRRQMGITKLDALRDLFKGHAWQPPGLRPTGQATPGPSHIAPLTLGE
jgi:hypothetical protein